MIGAYSLKNAAFDVGMIVIFGAFGYVARKNGFPFAPCVLAMILATCNGLAGHTLPAFKWGWKSFFTTKTL